MSNENDKNVEKRRAEKRARRRELYRMMQPEKKRALITRIQANRAERSRRLSENLVNPRAAIASSSGSADIDVSMEQNSLIIKESSPLPETGCLHMGERLNISDITPTTEEWTCKVQVVDKSRPRENKDKTKKYQLMILQDEKETQVLAIMFNTDITHFEDLFEPFKTYLVSVAQVKESSYRYGDPIYKFTWMIDLSTIVEPVEMITPPEAPLPPPTRLTLTPFDAFEHQPLKESEFDVLAIVVNGEPPKFAANGKLIQEFIIMDEQRKPTKLTLWEEFVDHDGSELFVQLNEYPVILARRVTKSSSGLSNRYNTTIQIDPPYPQANALSKWAETVRPKLAQYSSRTTSASGSLIFAPFEEEIISISEIQIQPSGKVFYIEGEISLQNVDQRFCYLACSKCKLQKKRTGIRREVHCSTCKHATMLVPICEFNVTVTDKSGSAIAIISDEPAHKLFSLTLEEIYDIRFVKKQLFPFDNVHKQLRGKIFRIQLKKLSSGKLFILAYEEKEHAQLLVPTSTMVNVVEGSKRKFDDVGTRDSEGQNSTTKNNPSCNKDKMEKRGPSNKH